MTKWKIWARLAMNPPVGTPVYLWNVEGPGRGPITEKSFGGCVEFMRRCRNSV